MVIPFLAVATGAVAVLGGASVETVHGTVGSTARGLLAVPEALRVAGVPPPTLNGLGIPFARAPGSRASANASIGAMVPPVPLLRPRLRLRPLDGAV